MFESCYMLFSDAGVKYRSQKDDVNVGFACQHVK